MLRDDKNKLLKQNTKVSCALDAMLILSPRHGPPNLSSWQTHANDRGVDHNRSTRRIHTREISVQHQEDFQHIYTTTALIGLSLEENNRDGCLFFSVKTALYHS